MNLDHLWYFKTLAETKNRRETAERMGITQPALSLAIGKLENELDTILIEKNKNGIKLTKDGETFYQYVDSSLRFLQNGIDALEESKRGANRTITIGCILSAEGFFWSKLIYEFRRRHAENIKLEIVQSTSPELFTMVKNGSIDVAFMGNLNEEDPTVACIPCWYQGVALAVNKRHPLAGREHISLAELKDYQIAAPILEGGVGPELMSLLDGKGLQVEYKYRNEIEIGGMVAANPDILAVTCTSWLLEGFKEEIELLTIDEAPEDFRYIYLRYSKAINQPKIAQDLIDLTVETFSS